MDSPVDKAFKVVFEIESIGKGKKESQFSFMSSFFSKFWYFDLVKRWIRSFVVFRERDGIERLFGVYLPETKISSNQFSKH